MLTEKRTPMVVFISGDPGGAAALTPVIQAVAGDGLMAIQALAYREARKVWAEKGIRFGELGGKLTLSNALSHLRALDPDLVVTSTSINSQEYEKLFLAAAKKIGIRSMSVLDFWSNYRYRFSDDSDNLVYLPDRIAVMDSAAVEEMIEVGIPADVIEVTGQPAFDDLAAIRSGFSTEDRASLRTELGIGAEELMIDFISQPFSDLFGNSDDHPGYPGFDEHSVLEGLVSALEQIASEEGLKIHLVIIPHLREDPKKFQTYQSESIRIIMEAAHDPRELISAADLVTGMTSTRLVEACYLGKLTVSLQPGLKKPDQLISNRQGYSVGVFRQEEIKETLARYLFDQQMISEYIDRLDDLSLISDAAQKVTELIYSMTEGVSAGHPGNAVSRRISC